MEFEQFRPLNDEERGLLMRVASKLTWEQLEAIEQGTVSYIRQGNFTTCVMLMPVQGTNQSGLMVGVTKRMVDDPERTQDARRISFRRAVENYAAS